MNTIKDTREKKGITQKQLSEMTGLRIKRISRYENNHYQPRADTLVKIAQVLNCTVDELLQN